MSLHALPSSDTFLSGSVCHGTVGGWLRRSYLWRHTNLTSKREHICIMRSRRPMIAEGKQASCDQNYTYDVQFVSNASPENSIQEVATPQLLLDAHTVETKVVLLQTISGNGNVCSQATVRSLVTVGECQLRADLGDARLQELERGPITPVQRQIDNRAQLHNPTDGGL